MVRPLSLSPIFSTSLLLLTTLTEAASPSPNSDDIKWLYPPPSAPSLTYNTLDAINVSWISPHTPAFLKLACQINNHYTTALELPIPATGNRIISLTPLAASTSPSYQSCRFEISVPSNPNSNNNTPSTSFNLTTLETKDPQLWTLDPSSTSTQYQQQKTRADAAKCKAQDASTSTMAAIGVGVAVGVFALTTACFVLFEVQRRRKRLAAEEAEAEKEKEEVVAKKWIAKTLGRRSEVDAVERGMGGRHEMDGGLVEDFPSRRVGGAG
ncbi:MAG: hypothetical protein Q9178_003947 [Gyalolechia marmorata]